MDTARKRSSRDWRLVKHTARKRSLRDLGLEDEAGQRKKSEKLPEEEEEKKKLYVFVWHSWCSGTANSLYALDIPSPGTMVKAVSYPEPERFPVEPVLRFSSMEWPRVMTCIGLKSKLYFLGGRWRKETQPLPNDVHILDLSSNEEIPSSFRDQPRQLLVSGPSMKTGKCHPVVCFVADGKIFVVSGNKHCPATGEELTQFEVFNPNMGKGKGKWLAPKHVPPFHDASYLCSPLIVNRNVFFVGHKMDFAGFTCCYNLDSGTWSERCPPGIGFRYENFTLQEGNHIYKQFARRVGSQAISKTLWNVCRRPITKWPGPVAVRLDISNKKEEKKYFDVVKHYIQSTDTEKECVSMGVSSILTRLGVGDGPRSVRLCYLEVAFPDEEEDLECCYLNVTLFDVHDNGDRAKYLTSAHYAAEVHGNPHHIMSAHAVSLSQLFPPLASST